MRLYVPLNNDKFKIMISSVKFKFLYLFFPNNVSMFVKFFVYHWFAIADMHVLSSVFFVFTNALVKLERKITFFLF